MSRPSKPKAAAAAAPAPETAAPAPAAAAPVDPIPVNTPQVAPDPTGAVSAPASAAAEAAAAPVDPNLPTGPGASPDPANDPDGNPPSTQAPEPAVPLAFVGPDEKGVEIVIVSAVQIDGVDVRSGSVILPHDAAKDLVAAGAATWAE